MTFQSNKLRVQRMSNKPGTGKFCDDSRLGTHNILTSEVNQVIPQIEIGAEGQFGSLFSSHPLLLEEQIKLFQNLLATPVNQQLLVYCIKLEIILLKFYFGTLRHNI